MMKTCFHKFFVTAIMLGMVLTGTSQAMPILDELTNGTFDSDLTSWTYSIGVGWYSGHAVLVEHDNGETSLLSQDFFLPEGAQELSFEINFTVEGEGFPDTDVFTASLLPGYSDFYYWDSDVGDLYDTADVMVADIGDGWQRVTLLDVSSLAGTNVTLAFSLLSDTTDNLITSVDLDNVKISTTVVPAPGAIVLGFIGTGLVGVFSRRKKVR